MNYKNPPHTIRARATRALVELHNGEQPKRKGVPETEALMLLKFERLIKMDIDTGHLVITSRGKQHISLMGFEVYPSLEQRQTA
jgi:hypothetical protein